MIYGYIPARAQLERCLISADIVSWVFGSLESQDESVGEGQYAGLGCGAATNGAVHSLYDVLSNGPFGL